MIDYDATTSIYRSPAFPPPQPPNSCIRVAIADVYPYPENATAAQRKVIDFIRGWLHPDTLRRRPGFAEEAYDGYLHLDWMREATKSFFVDYLEGVRVRLGPVPDDGED